MFRTTATRTLTHAARLTFQRACLPALRTFTSTTPIAKKASKPAKGDHHHVPTNDPPPAIDGFDFDAHFADLGAELAKITEKLKNDLAKFRTGRADPSQFENIAVMLDKSAGESALVKEVAHVVVKGRNIAVGVYEASNIKRVFAALQKADMNITPVIDAKNPNNIMMPLPPPTKESRLATVAAAAAVGEKTNMALRNARQGSHKKIKSFKTMRSDDQRKADKQLEKIMEAAGAEAKAIIEGAKKAIMEG